MNITRLLMIGRRAMVLFTLRTVRLVYRGYVLCRRLKRCRLVWFMRTRVRSRVRLRRWTPYGIVLRTFLVRVFCGCSLLRVAMVVVRCRFGLCLMRLRCICLIRGVLTLVCLGLFSLLAMLNYILCSLCGLRTLLRILRMLMMVLRRILTAVRRGRAMRRRSWILAVCRPLRIA